MNDALVCPVGIVTLAGTLSRVEGVPARVTVVGAAAASLSVTFRRPVVPALSVSDAGKNVIGNG